MTETEKGGQEIQTTTDGATLTVIAERATLTATAAIATTSAPRITATETQAAINTVGAALAPQETASRATLPPPLPTRSGCLDAFRAHDSRHDQ